MAYACLKITTEKALAMAFMVLIAQIFDLAE